MFLETDKVAPAAGVIMTRLNPVRGAMFIAPRQAVVRAPEGCNEYWNERSLPETAHIAPLGLGACWLAWSIYIPPLAELVAGSPGSSMRPESIKVEAVIAAQSDRRDTTRWQVWLM